MSAPTLIAEERASYDPIVRAAEPGSAIDLPASRFPHPASNLQPPRLGEAQLSTLWRGRRFPDGALVTRAGVPVNVIFQGRAGRGPGPDYRGAVIAGPSGVTLRGDVELHVRSSDFRAHGHHADAAYRNVILHVVFDDDTGADTPLPGGGSAPVIELASWVARRAGELQRWIERPLLWREPCHDAVMRMGAEGAGAALDAEGDRRFDAKVARWRETIRSGGIEQALYEGLLEALGYGGNATQMLALARLLPRARLRALARGDQLRAEALLLGSGGLLPSQRAHRGRVEAHIDALEGVFAGAPLPSLQAGTWKLWGVRPENAPARRVAAAAALLTRLGDPAALLRIVEATTVNEAIAPLLISAEGYWRTHHDLCAGSCRLPPAFVGRSRALEIIINVVLPIAAASGDPALRAKARVLFARLPRPAVYGATKFIEAALASEGIRVPVNARRAQGLLELQRNWCTENGCGRCVLSSS